MRPPDPPTLSEASFQDLQYAPIFSFWVLTPFAVWSFLFKISCSFSANHFFPAQLWRPKYSILFSLLAIFSTSFGNQSRTNYKGPSLAQSFQQSRFSKKHTIANQSTNMEVTNKYNAKRNESFDGTIKAISCSGNCKHVTVDVIVDNIEALIEDANPVETEGDDEDFDGIEAVEIRLDVKNACFLVDHDAIKLFNVIDFLTTVEKPGCSEWTCDEYEGSERCGTENSIQYLAFDTEQENEEDFAVRDQDAEARYLVNQERMIRLMEARPKPRDSLKLFCPPGAKAQAVEAALAGTPGLSRIEAFAIIKRNEQTHKPGGLHVKFEVGDAFEGLYPQISVPVIVTKVQKNELTGRPEKVISQRDFKISVHCAPSLRKEKCVYCRLFGHLVDACPKKLTVVCFRCREQGHLKKNCPLRTFPGLVSQNQNFAQRHFRPGQAAQTANRRDEIQIEVTARPCTRPGCETGLPFYDCMCIYLPAQAKSAGQELDRVKRSRMEAVMQDLNPHGPGLPVAASTPATAEDFYVNPTQAPNVHASFVTPVEREEYFSASEHEEGELEEDDDPIPDGDTEMSLEEAQTLAPADK